MKRFFKVAGIVALTLVLSVAILGTVAFAQGDEDTPNSPFDFRARFRSALAGILGITVEEYDSAVDQAKDQVVDQALEEGWLTEDQAELFKWRLDQLPGDGMWGRGKPFGHMDRGMLGGTNLLSIAADKLGMSLTELLTELQGGKNIAEVAQAKGVDTQTIIDAYLAQVRERLALAVENGTMTQKQMDWQLARAEQQVTNQLNSTWQGCGPGSLGRRGGMWGFPGMGGGMRGNVQTTPGTSGL